MIHHVFATKSNIGDWLSARGIQLMMRPHRVVEHYCDAPFVPETLARLSRLTADDLIIIGGGGLLMNYFDPFWDGMRAIVRRVPTCIWGVGLVDLKRAPSRASLTILDDIIPHSAFCSVRDELSRAFLSKHEGIETVPCPATVAVEPGEGDSRGLLYADHYSVVGADGYERIRRVATEFAAKTGRRYCEVDNQISDGKENELSALLSRYREADLVVSSRLHGCIIGLSMGRKVLAVSGDHKVESFMNSAGLGEWVCPGDDEQEIRSRLAMLGTQSLPQRFLADARRSNHRIAEKVRSLADKAALTRV